MLTAYFSILVFIGIGALIGVIPLVLAFLLAPSHPYPEKKSPYECGFEAFEDARSPFHVRYYLVAILFILFDVETAFFFPWAVSLRATGWLGFYSMLIFILILALGLVYEWKKGALEWE